MVERLPASGRLRYWWPRGRKHDSWMRNAALSRMAGRSQRQSTRV